MKYRIYLINFIIYTNLIINIYSFMWNISCIKIKSSERYQRRKAISKMRYTKCSRYTRNRSVPLVKSEEEKRLTVKKSVISQKSEALLQKILFLSDADSDD